MELTVLRVHFRQGLHKAGHFLFPVTHSNTDFFLKLYFSGTGILTCKEPVLYISKTTIFGGVDPLIDRDKMTLSILKSSTNFKIYL